MGKCENVDCHQVINGRCVIMVINTQTHNTNFTQKTSEVAKMLKQIYTAYMDKWQIEASPLMNPPVQRKVKRRR